METDPTLAIGIRVPSTFKTYIDDARFKDEKEL